MVTEVDTVSTMATYEAVRELCSRLPDVPEPIITHFLTKVSVPDKRLYPFGHGLGVDKSLLAASLILHKYSCLLYTSDAADE